MTTLLASAARTTSGTSAITLSRSLADVVGAVFMLDITADESTVADTLNVYLQHSVDGSSWDDFCHWTQKLGNAGASKEYAFWSSSPTPETEMRAPQDAALAAGAVVQGPVGSSWRAKWVIVDDSTSASFTFSIEAELQRDRARTG